MQKPDASKRRHSRNLRRWLRAAGESVARTFLVAAFTLLYGLLLGLACRSAMAQGSANPSSAGLGLARSPGKAVRVALSTDELEPLGIPLVLPPGEELVPEAELEGLSPPSVETLRGWPSRVARAGRPLDAAMVARKLSFRCRFADFPEYKAEDTPPSIRIFDFTNARWEQ